jgi:CRISPR-associated protein Csb2
MPSRALVIEVRLIEGRYHGVGDWPPAPFRLFQALVAGAYGGRWCSESPEEKDAAFHWLEGLSPPYVAAPAKIDARATTYFVPNNDLDAVGGDPRRISEIRAAKTSRAMLFDPDAPCLYAWPFDEGESYALRLCGLAQRLHTLGWGLDAAFAHAEVCDWNEVEARFARHGGAVGRPGLRGEARDPSCPADGSLDSLKARHVATAQRFETRREGRTTVTHFRQPPKATSVNFSYNRPPHRLLLDLCPSDGARPFRAVAQERTAEVAKAVRDLAVERLTKSLPERAAEIERIVVGRGAGPADIPRRVRFVPLPSIGFTYADPSIRRVLIEVPPDCPVPMAEIAWAVSGQSLVGFDRVDPITREVVETILTPATDDSMLSHYGIDRHGSRRWHTITPLVLPQRRQPGRLGGTARVEADERAAAVVAQALRHAGFDWRGTAIRIQAEPFHRKGARADTFQSGRFEGRLRHVEIFFPEAVAGPMVIGDGRWLGLGVMAPASDAPPAVHVFAIDPAAAPPLAQREALVRALRRAVLARVNEELGDSRRRGPLATFFTGHELDGTPARSGQHEHLFFLADDLDGDGRIDRLAVVSPHLADRIARDSWRMREILGHLHLLDRALVGLTVLRAGHAGAPRLARVAGPSDEDRVFGQAKNWVSLSLYHPTRHPKGGSADAKITADLLAECARRGLPRPEIDVLDVAIGPRDGVAVGARLRFKVSIRGPLVLGRGSHFGAGLFGAER